ncbi:MAG: MCE family protein [Planctomycetales bacterium]|nr:MCE family protein [Planctomycetales bacterium]MCA9180883.1 MCE family protein [Planctomycetales bacterium]
MDDQGYRFGVGVLVVASLVIAVILILFFGAAPNFFVERYTVTIRFQAAPGVASDTPVRKNGVQIGRVKSVQLLDEEGVDLTLELDGKYKVRAQELPQIGKGSLITGDAVVEFVPPTQESLITRFDGTGGSPRDGILDENEMLLAATPIQDGDFFRGGRVAPDPLDALLNMQEGFGTTLSAIETAGNQVTALALDVRKLLGSGDGAMQDVARKMDLTIDNFNDTLDAIEGLFNDPNLKSSLDTLAARLPDIVNEAESVMKQTGDTLAAFEDVGRAAEETVRGVTKTVEHVNQLTEPLGRNGEKLVGDAVRTLDNLNLLLTDLRSVADRFNSGQGTVAKLIDDPQLYYQVMNTLGNIETLTRKLEPIVDDARVFTDKVARQPSSLIDLRGAISGRPLGAGIK